MVPGVLLSIQAARLPLRVAVIILTVESEVVILNAGPGSTTVKVPPLWVQLVAVEPFKITMLMVLPPKATSETVISASAVKSAA